MPGLTDRQLIDRTLMNYTTAGWQVASQSDSGFQVIMPHVISAAAVAVFVIAPMGLGVLASLVTPVVGVALFWLALLMAVVIVLHHFTIRPQLHYVTADQLRNPPPVTIQHSAQGVTVCSACHAPVRSDAPVCRKCNATFSVPVVS